ncbi:hypothetical protein ACS0TY_033380 [Phlomoides rotata]
MYFLMHPAPVRNNIRFDMIWRHYIGPKYSFLGWLVLKEKLATKDRLSFLNIDPWCCHCITRQEDLQHLFWRCPYNRKIWMEIKCWVRWNSHIKTVANTLQEIKT